MSFKSKYFSFSSSSPSLPEQFSPKAIRESSTSSASMTDGRESHGGPEQGGRPRQGEKDSTHARGQPNIGVDGPRTVRKASTCRDGLEESM